MHQGAGFRTVGTMDRNVVMRSLPAVDKVVAALADLPLPAPVRVRLARRHLEMLRRSADDRTEPFEAEVVLKEIRDQAAALARARIQPVLNGTGILIHTNLGRSPLAPAAADHLRAVATGYCNVELDLEEGRRGPRAAYLEACLAALCEAEAATAVNNCAAALVLVLKTFVRAGRDEVIVSRGELVEIGGGFRIPEILEASGARLREVGTTNRTRLADYESALGPATALILKVHQSNFHLQGFTEEASLGELAELADRANIPLVHDLGSGAVMDIAALAPLEHEPTPAESLRAGAGLVCFSGDKLLGGPQSGLVAGRAEWVGRIKKEPFFRALRCDKLILTVLQETVAAYLEARSDPAVSPVPVVAMLRLPLESLRARGEALRESLDGKLAGVRVEVGESEARTGGGTLPRSSLPSVSLDLVPVREGPGLDTLAARLRAGRPPVVGYAAPDRFRLDLRTIFPEQDKTLERVLKIVLGA